MASSRNRLPRSQSRNLRAEHPSAKAGRRPWRDRPGPGNAPSRRSGPRSLSRSAHSTQANPLLEISPRKCIRRAGATGLGPTDKRRAAAVLRAVGPIGTNRGVRGRDSPRRRDVPADFNHGLAGSLSREQPAAWLRAGLAGLTALHPTQRSRASRLPPLGGGRRYRPQNGWAPSSGYGTGSVAAAACNSLSSGTARSQQRLKRYRNPAK